MPDADPSIRPALVHAERLEHYSFGEGHPMGPGRVSSALDLSRHLGLLDAFDVVDPPDAADDLLTLVHTPDYLAAIRSGLAAPRYGLGDADNPVTAGLDRVAAGVVGASVEAARLVWSGQTHRALNVSGGLHHAQPAATSGFCVLNDAAVAIRWLLNAGAERVAYLDLDAHHGDGVQSVFWNEPRVLTLSLHESPLHLFPHTGFPHETGGPAAQGRTANVALPPGTADEPWLRALAFVAPPLLAAFRPQVLVTQHGADAHRRDTLTHLALSMEGLAAAWRHARDLAERFAGGRWVALGGGGYDLDSVARAWTHLVATVADADLDPATRTPPGWLGGRGSATLGDGRASDLAGYEPGAELHDWPDPPVVATSRKVFRHWGLEPW